MLKGHEITKAMEEHGQRRAYEREGATNPAALCKAICQEIKNGNGCRILARTNRVSLQGAVVESRLYVVAYDHKRHIVVTFIPKWDTAWNYARMYFARKGVQFYEE